jgi:hypothetical protein
MIGFDHGTAWEGDDRQGNEARRGNAAGLFHLAVTMLPQLWRTQRIL